MKITLAFCLLLVTATTYSLLTDNAFQAYPQASSLGHYPEVVTFPDGELCGMLWKLPDPNPDAWPAFAVYVDALGTVKVVHGWYFAETVLGGYCSTVAAR